MATQRTIQPPQPQIFQPDALEQIYASSTMKGDPTTSGLAYAFLNAAKGDRADNQGVYLKDLRMANMLNTLLEQADIQAGIDKTAMQQGVEASDKLGIPLDAMKAYGLLVNNPKRAGKEITDLTTRHKQSQINKNNAEAANGGGSVDTRYAINPFGVDVTVTGKKGATPSDALLEAARQRALRMTRDQHSQVPGAVLDYYKTLPREPRGGGQ